MLFIGIYDKGHYGFGRGGDRCMALWMKINEKGAWLDGLPLDFGAYGV